MAMHSAATQDFDKSWTRDIQVGGRSNPYLIKPPVNLDYQQAVETLLAHGADLSAQDKEVNTLTARLSACTTPVIKPRGYDVL